MRIGLIADVHANLPALEAVLADYAARGIETIWNLGDFVGYGAFPEEVVQLLSQKAAINIIGNYDLKVLQFPQKSKKWRYSKHPIKYLAFQWAYENLSQTARDYLSELPEEVRLEVEGWSILLTHASPYSNEEPITLQTPRKRFIELAKMAKADIVLFGHSHQPFSLKVDKVWFINPGSVGRPDDGDPRASFAVLQIEPGLITCEHYRIEYDLEKATSRIMELNLPEAFAEMVIQGYSLDAILGDKPD